MKKFALLALPVIAAATPAAAQEVQAAGGPRVELMVGYDRLSSQFDADDIEDVTLSSSRAEGIVYGGTIGFDFGSTPGLLFGVDAELTESDGDIIFFGEDDEGEDASVEFETGRDIYVGGRVTAALSPNFNIYGKLGYSNLNFSLETGDEATDEAIDDIIDDEGFDTTLHGIRGAVGFAYAPEGQAYYGLEFRYSNYQAGVERRQAAIVVGYRF